MFQFHHSIRHQPCPGDITLPGVFDYRLSHIARGSGPSASIYQLIIRLAVNKIYSLHGVACGIRGSGFRDDIPSRIRNVRHNNSPGESKTIRFADKDVGEVSYIESAISDLGTANVVGVGLRCSSQGKTQEGHRCKQGKSHVDANWLVSMSSK